MSAMRPYVICHMVSSVDGKIDGKALQQVMLKGEYEAVAAKLDGDAWICGRTTMQQHFAKDEPFVSASKAPAGPQPVYVARRSGSYAISVDTLGKLRWPSGDLDGDHLVCVVSERVPTDYLAMLREKNISTIRRTQPSGSIFNSNPSRCWSGTLQTSTAMSATGRFFNSNPNGCWSETTLALPPGFMNYVLQFELQQMLE